MFSDGEDNSSSHDLMTSRRRRAPTLWCTRFAIQRKDTEN